MTNRDKWHVATQSGRAKNHAIAHGPYIKATVLGGGYPVGEGWSPTSEATAEYLAKAANCHDDLVKACNLVIRWLGDDDESDFEHCGNANDAFKKALKACRAAVAKTNT